MTTDQLYARVRRMMFALSIVVIFIVVAVGWGDQYTSCVRQGPVRWNQQQIMRPFIMKAARVRYRDGQDAAARGDGAIAEENFKTAALFQKWANEIRVARPLDCFPIPEIR